MSLPCGCPSARCLVATLVLPCGLWAQPAVPGPVLQLPTYTVTGERELPPPERWFYARIPGFEVLSNASAAKTKDLLGEFQRFTHALNLVWPGLVPPSAAPASLILCGSGDKFGTFLPTASGSERAMASITLRSRDQAAIALDMQTSVLNLPTSDGPAPVVVDADGNADGSNLNPGIAVDAYRQLNREYIRYLLTGRESPAPAWFAEGLAQLFMAMEVTETTITLGKLADPNLRTEPMARGRAAPEEDRDFNAALATSALIPMAEMLTVSTDSTEAKNPLGRVWAKQCYAFVHWGLYGDDGAHQKNFFIFLARLGSEPLSESLFEACFKADYREMLSTLRGYIQVTRHKVAGIKADKGQKIPEPPPVAVREATQAEVGRVVGDALLLAGHPAEARAVYVTAYRRGERDPALLAALGLAELAAGDRPRAQSLLQAALAGRALRPRAGLELARLRLTDALAQPQADHGKLSAAQVSHAMEPLLAAPNQPPPPPESFELMANIWAHSATPPSATDLAAVEQGVRLYPRQTELVYRAAELRAHNGYPREAHGLVRLGLRLALDAPTRARFEKLLAALPPEPPAPEKL
jgi:tetratricopeptide (TPR) repeat protein